jgi:predicted site-specific integrase-resolvase
MWRVEIEPNGKPHPNAGPAVVSLSRWLEQVGVTPCTAWRWRKKSWLKTTNIAGRQYLTQEAIEEFHRRASAGEFSQVNKVPSRKAAGVGG